MVFALLVCPETASANHSLLRNYSMLLLCSPRGFAEMMSMLNIPYYRLHLCLIAVQQRQDTLLPTCSRWKWIFEPKQPVCLWWCITRADEVSLSSPFLHLSNRWHPRSLFCYFGTTRPRRKLQVNITVQAQPMPTLLMAKLLRKVNPSS